MIQRVFFPQLPGLNEIIAAAKVHDRQRGSWNKYAELKKRYERDLVILIKAAKLQPVQRAKFTFAWRERSTHRDPDNVAGGGQKIVLDALVAATILEDDGWQQVHSILHLFVVSPSREAGVTVEIESV